MEAAHQWDRPLFEAARGEGNAVVQRQQAVDADTAAARVRSATGGQVLGVRLGSADGQTIYQVKVLLPCGRVRVVRVDAQTGQILD